MSNFGIVDCANCGRQTEVDRERPGDTCLFCGKPADKKEDIMVEQKETAEQVHPSVEFGDMDIHARGRYIKAHLAEIVDDIRSMSNAEVMAKWGFKDTTCRTLRKKHAPGTSGKSKDRKSQVKKAASEPSVSAKEKTEKSIAEDSAPLTEHEHYLILLGYQQAVRDILK